MVTKLNPYYFTFNVITNQFIPREFNSDNSGLVVNAKDIYGSNSFPKDGL